MNRRIALRAAFLLVPLLVVALGYGVRHFRYHLIERNVREVDPGRIYAGGYQHPIPLARILERYHIKTVLSLYEPGVSGDRKEQAVLAENGVAFRRVPMRSMESTPEVIALVEEAVQILADEQNQPVFVHCLAGMHRTGVVIAAYRVTHCGWSEEEARTELLRYANDSVHTDWACEVFSEYCRRRRVDADRHDDEVLDAVRK